MTKIFGFFLFSIFISTFSRAQGVQLLSFNEVNQIISKKDEKTRVINFWATWCKPCVEELPLFKMAAEDAAFRNAEFIFISVDFQSQHQKVLDKIAELKLTGTQIHLNEKGTDWIDEIDPDWPGAIPYTMLILPDGKRIYHYDEFDNYNDLKNFLAKNLPN